MTGQVCLHFLSSFLYKTRRKNLQGNLLLANPDQTKFSQKLEKNICPVKMLNFVINLLTILQTTNERVFIEILEKNGEVNLPFIFDKNKRSHIENSFSLSIDFIGFQFEMRIFVQCFCIFGFEVEFRLKFLWMRRPLNKIVSYDS